MKRCNEIAKSKSLFPSHQTSHFTLLRTSWCQRSCRSGSYSWLNECLSASFQFCLSSVVPTSWISCSSLTEILRKHLFLLVLAYLRAPTRNKEKFEIVHSTLCLNWALLGILKFQQNFPNSNKSKIAKKSCRNERGKYCKLLPASKKIL
jgi:hypothetical protein